MARVPSPARSLYTKKTRASRPALVFSFLHGIAVWMIPAGESVTIRLPSHAGAPSVPSHAQSNLIAELMKRIIIEQSLHPGVVAKDWPQNKWSSFLCKT